MKKIKDSLIILKYRFFNWRYSRDAKRTQEKYDLSSHEVNGFDEIERINKEILAVQVKVHNNKMSEQIGEKEIVKLGEQLNEWRDKYQYSDNEPDDIKKPDEKLRDMLAGVCAVSAFILLGIHIVDFFILDKINPGRPDSYYWALIFPAIGLIYTAYHITNVESKKLKD